MTQNILAKMFNGRWERCTLVTVTLLACLFGLVFSPLIWIRATGKITVTEDSPRSDYSYLIFKDGSTYYAQSGETGEISWSSTNATSVWENVRDLGLTSGRDYKETVMFKGEFLVSAPLVVEEYTIIDGDAELTWNGGNNNYIFDTRDNGFIEIHHLRLTQNASQTNITGILSGDTVGGSGAAAQHCYDSLYIDDLAVGIDGGLDGAGAALYDSKIDNCYFYQCNTGLIIDELQISVDNSMFFDCVVGIEINYGNIQMYNTVISACNYSIVMKDSNRGIKAIGCWLENAEVGNMWMNASSIESIGSTVLEGTHLSTDSGADYLINMTQASGSLTIDSCHISQSSGASLTITLGEYVDFVPINTYEVDSNGACKKTGTVGDRVDAKVPNTDLGRFYIAWLNISDGESLSSGVNTYNFACETTSIYKTYRVDVYSASNLTKPFTIYAKQTTTTNLRVYVIVNDNYSLNGDLVFTVTAIPSYDN